MMGYYKKDYNQEIDDEKMSRINSAGIINITLENLWRDCYSAMAKGDLVTWHRKLDAVWAILGGDVKEGDDTDKQIAELDAKIYATGNLNHKKTGFEKLDENESEKMSLQYLLLKNKSLFLRRLQNKQGKGTAYTNEDWDDFD